MKILFKHLLYSLYNSELTYFSKSYIITNLYKTRCKLSMRDFYFSKQIKTKILLAKHIKVMSLNRTQ